MPVDLATLVGISFSGTFIDFYDLSMAPNVIGMIVFDCLLNQMWANWNVGENGSFYQTRRVFGKKTSFL